MIKGYIESEYYVIKKLGKDVQMTDLKVESKDYNWNELSSIGCLCSDYELDVYRNDQCKIADIERAIGEDGQYSIVIVPLSESILTSSPSDGLIAFVYRTCNENEVCVYNPLVGKEEVFDIKTFQQAWSASGNYIVAINDQGYAGYDPYPMDLSCIKIPSELLELREAIAEHLHDVWARKRRDEGWTYGIRRDDIKKQTPDMVPYSMLPDSEKEYDRAMAQNTLQLIQALGHRIS